MDELEEFLTVFYQECDERLGELQDNLAQMVDGDWDAETLNAAFRAVHSVKGGAGAFGLDELVEFTHVFETTMDALRSDKLEPTRQVCQVLLRASDMMQALIEKAQGNGEANPETRDKIMAELATLAGGEAPASKPADEAAPAAADAASIASETAEAATAEDEALDDLPEDREVIITVTPADDFVRAGHDPLKMVRGLKQFGPVRVEKLGDHPPLESVDPTVIELSWRITLDTDVEPEQLSEFLSVYQLSADVGVEDPKLAADGSDTDAADAAEQPVGARATQDENQPKADDAKADEPKPDAPTPAETKAETPKVEAAPSADKPTEKRASAPPKHAQALRVELSRIDRLVNMVGEIVITQAVLAQHLSEFEGVGDLEIGHAVEALSRQTRELQESVMAIRAQPVKSVFSRMPRVVRDLCNSLDKEAKIILSGEEVEVDTTVIEELAEPLTHMLRNSMDHGIESPDKREAAGKPRGGTIHLSAEHRGERVRILIEDDGAGINRERVLSKAIERGIVPEDAALADEEIDALIFHPGFSTAEQVTNVSGRGVGMDVVKKKVQTLGGRVSVVSRPGQGSQFAITLPLTLAVLDGMTVGVGEERFILPLGSVVEAVKIDEASIDKLPGEVGLLRYRGEWLKLISLRETLSLGAADGENGLVVVVETETEGRVAIRVDELLGQRQVVLKSLEANFKRVPGVSGATILGDGRVALILDIPTLLSLSNPTEFQLEKEVAR